MLDILLFLSPFSYTHLDVYKRQVQDIRTNSMGCILFGKDTGIKEGTKVTRTGKQAGIPVGNGYVGRIVNALGAPIDGKGEIKEEGYRPVELSLIHI